MCENNQFVLDLHKLISTVNYGITVDSMKIKKSVESLIYDYSDFNFGFRDLNLLPTDSSFQLSVSTFSISFVNVVIKSALMGLKETVIMSKENRKAYSKAKKRAKEEQKKLK